MFKLTCFVVCVVMVTWTSVYAVTEEEKAVFRDKYQEVVAECSQSLGVSDDELKTAEKTSNADILNPCFFGCVFKKTGILDAQGLFDFEGGFKHITPIIKDAAQLAKFEEIGKQCLSVNEEAVSDGEAGCERGKLLLGCILERRAEIQL